MTNGKGGTVIPTKRRAKRGVPGGAGATKLRRRRTYWVRCDIFNRLAYYGVKPLTSGSAKFPDARHGESMRPSSYEPYPMKGLWVTLKRKGHNMGIQSTSAHGLVSFTGLKPGLTYELEAHFAGTAPVADERITGKFKVKSLPRAGKSVKISVTVEHEVAQPTGAWVSVKDQETIKARLYRDRGDPDTKLFIDYSDPLILDTIGLKVGFVSQNQGHNDLKHKFRYRNGKEYIVEVTDYHLCITTCVTMVLRYYGINVTPLQVCEAAGRFLLDVETKKTPRPPGWSWRPDRSAGNVLQNTAKAGPYTDTIILACAARELLGKSKLGADVNPWGGRDNLVTKDKGKTLKYLLSVGMPVILIEDLPGSVEHARVCCGALVKNNGDIHALYGWNPNTPSLTTISTAGTQSNRGWLLVGRTMKQKEISPKLLMAGGAVPVARL